MSANLPVQARCFARIRFWLGLPRLGCLGLRLEVRRNPQTPFFNWLTDSRAFEALQFCMDIIVLFTILCLYATSMLQTHYHPPYIPPLALY
jgi:hypothetical protein